MVVAIIGSILLFSISILYFLLVLGKPYGFLAWGGKHMTTLPKDAKIQTGLSIPVQLLAIYTLLKKGTVLGSSGGLIITIFSYIFMIMFFFNIVTNLSSKSKYEKLIMTPIAAFVCFSFGYVLFLIS